MRILGIDPGLATVGFAVLDTDGREKELISVGVIKTAAGTPDPIRLKEIYDDITALIHEYKPDSCAVEQIFFSKNVSTGIQVAQARGVIMLALENAALKIYEYTPSAMKLALTGDGNADKKAIQKMVCIELGLDEAPKPDDAANAVSLALSLSSELRWQ